MLNCNFGRAARLVSAALLFYLDPAVSGCLLACMLAVRLLMTREPPWGCRCVLTGLCAALLCLPMMLTGGAWGRLPVQLAGIPLLTWMFLPAEDAVDTEGREGPEAPAQWTEIRTEFRGEDMGTARERPYARGGADCIDV